MNEEIGRSKKAAASDMTLAATCWAASIWIFPFRLRSKTDRESSGVNRGRKGGARERADDVLLFRRNKRTWSQSKLCDHVAEMEGFEPPRRFHGLPHFECGPFSHLGTSPWCYESADSLFIILPCFSSVNTRFCRFLISRSSLKNPLSIWEHSSCKTPRVTST